MSEFITSHYEHKPPEDDVLFWASWTLLQYQRNNEYGLGAIHFMEKQILPEKEC